MKFEDAKQLVAVLLMCPKVFSGGVRYDQAVAKVQGGGMEPDNNVPAWEAYIATDSGMLGLGVDEEGARRRAEALPAALEQAGDAMLPACDVRTCTLWFDNAEDIKPITVLMDCCSKGYTLTFCRECRERMGFTGDADVYDRRGSADPRKAPAVVMMPAGRA